jgi:KUP system potassium uptake protein
VSIPVTKTTTPFHHLKEAIKALGIVFGDIGTSPIYTLTITFAFIEVSPANVVGVLSLIIWTLTMLVSAQYAWLAMSLSQNGEGGTIVLRELLVPLLRSKKAITLATFLSFIGISFLIGDGVITPAISILSAVEGLRLIPALQTLPTILFIALACLIAIILFTFQRKGTETVSVAFGPIMVVWFLSLGSLGIFWLIQEPWLLKAFNPLYAYIFLKTNKWLSFIALSKVILCATGGEALYTDMGHLGRKPIIRAWFFAFIILLLNYLGQGAFLLKYPTAPHIFYSMILTTIHRFYIPFLLLSMVATVIASQAMISGIFSIVYQGITTNIMPKLKIDYTSRTLRSQIYIPLVNRFLLVLVIGAIVTFRSSYNLANIYGLAATCTMTITSIMMIMIFYLKQQWFKAFVSCCIACINSTYLLSSTTKLPHGAYWSLLIALLPLSLILVYTRGKARLYEALSPMSLTSFLQEYTHLHEITIPIQGTALFFSHSIQKIPSYIAHTVFTNNILYEDMIIVSVVTHDKPYGITTSFKDLAPGLRAFKVHRGYMEIMNMEKILRSAHLEPKVIFYGMEEIGTNNIFWQIFALIKKLTPSFVYFYKLPTDKLHGVVVRVEM